MMTNAEIKKSLSKLKDRLEDLNVSAQEAAFEIFRMREDIKELEKQIDVDD